MWTSAEQQRNWQRKNKDKLRIYYLRYYKKTRKKRILYARNYQKARPEFTVWTNMNTRCKNPKYWNFKIYGGRGIKVLYKNFKEFLLDVGKRPTLKHCIDRINNDGNYEIGNCRCVTV